MTRPGLFAYGPGSEKLPGAQLELLELEPGVSSSDGEAESQRQALPSSPKTKRKHPGRQSLPSYLPRIATGLELSLSFIKEVREGHSY